MKLTTEERFWAKVDRSGGADACWRWAAYLDPRGYGAFATNHSKMRGAHRVAWELTFGPIRGELDVLHRCDNPACVNPTHLFLGNHQANMDDRNHKGRHAHGESHGKAKLTEPKVIELRRLRGEGWSFGMLAIRYGITSQAASDAACGKSWKHLGQPEE